MTPGVQEQPIRVTRQRSAAINQESTQSLTTATQPSSSAATNQESTQIMIAATQPSSPIQADSDDHIAHEGK